MGVETLQKNTKFGLFFLFFLLRLNRAGTSGWCPLSYTQAKIINNVHYENIEQKQYTKTKQKQTNNEKHLNYIYLCLSISRCIKDHLSSNCNSQIYGAAHQPVELAWTWYLVSGNEMENKDVHEPILHYLFFGTQRWYRSVTNCKYFVKYFVRLTRNMLYQF